MMKRINISFYFLVFFALIISSIVIALLYKASPLFTSKILFLCQKFISDVMFEVPKSLPSTLIFAIIGVLGIGLLSFLLQLVKTHFLLRKLLVKKINLSPDLAKTVENLSLTKKVVLVKNRALFSFCCGIFSPFIVVSTGLVKSLIDKELEAVLLHEQSHLISRDPIKVLVGKTFSSMFFFLPIFRELHKNIEAVNELLADQWTINHQQQSTFLKGALKKILVTPQLNLSTVSSAAGPDYREEKSLSYFEIRIHRLVNPGIKPKFSPSLKSLMTTAFFFFASWFLLQTPVSAFHMDSQSNSTYFLCSADESCINQCHDVNQSTNYIPNHLLIPEGKCDNPKSVNHTTSFSPLNR